MNDTVHCRMVVGGENSQHYGAKPQNRKASVRAEHSAFSPVSVTGMESTDLLYQSVPPTGLPETYVMSHHCLPNTLAKTICIFLSI